MTMKTTLEQNLLAAALACALGATAAHAQTQSGFYRPLTLAPADATSSGGGGAEADAADQQAELAKKLQNPVAALISVPIQNNWDFGIGSANAMRYTANIQPVIPISISKDWNLILRTILPVIYAESPVKGVGRFEPFFSQEIKIGIDRRGEKMGVRLFDALVSIPHADEIIEFSQGEKQVVAVILFRLMVEEGEDLLGIFI